MTRDKIKKKSNKKMRTILHKINQIKIEFMGMKLKKI